MITLARAMNRTAATEHQNNKYKNANINNGKTETKGITTMRSPTVRRKEIILTITITKNNSINRHENNNDGTKHTPNAKPIKETIRVARTAQYQ